MAVGGLSLECMHLVLVSFHFHSQTEPMAREHDGLFCHEPCSTKQAGEVGSPSSLEVYTPVPTHFSLGAPSEGIISLPGAPFGDQFFHIHTFGGTVQIQSLENIFQLGVAFPIFSPLLFCGENKTKGTPQSRTRWYFKTWRKIKLPESHKHKESICSFITFN